MKLAHLRELASKATKIPWEALTGHKATVMAHNLDTFVCNCHHDDCSTNNSKEDAHLIAAMRNHIDALLDLWEAAKNCVEPTKLSADTAVRYHHERNHAYLKTALERLEAIGE